MARRAERDETKQTLTFRVGDDRFAVPAGLVREVARMPRVTRVPHAPDSLIGIGNFRGTVLPVVSFARLTDRTAEGERRVILLDTANPVAIAVDEVTALGTDDNVRTIDVDALAARDFAGSGRKARVAAAIAKTDIARAEAIDAATLVAFA